jgi:hypothetical protein
MNMNEPPSLLRNDVSSGGHWLKVRLVGVQTNRSAIGSRVTVRYGDRLQAQEVTAQASFLSANDKRLHFGLGKVSSRTVDVYWPGGRVDSVKDVQADQMITIKVSGVSTKQPLRRKAAVELRARRRADGRDKEVVSKNEFVT